MADPNDPWIQAQQQAQQQAYSMWGQLPGTTAYQADPGIVPTQNPGGGYSSGEDWARAQQAAQARSDATMGPAPGIGYKGQSGPYGAPADQPMAANYLTARPDQWAMNGSGPAIAPAMQQAVNEDPRLADVYSQAGVSRLNNVGNGYGVLPGALTPGVMGYNGGQMPSSFNQLLQYSAQNPGSPMGMNNLGPAVAQQMRATPLQGRMDGAGLPEGINPSGEYNNRSFYDYSSPNGSTANSRGAQLAAQQRGLGALSAFAQPQSQGPMSAGPYTYLPPMGGGQSKLPSVPVTGAIGFGGLPGGGAPAASSGSMSKVAPTQPLAPQQQGAINPQMQALASLLMGQQPAMSAGPKPNAPGMPQQQQSAAPMGGNPLLGRSMAALSALGRR